MNYNIILFLAWCFFRIQGLVRIQNGSVSLYCEYLNLGRKRSSREKKPLKSESYYMYSEHFGLCRKRRDREKESPKCKTKPFQSHSKPFFSRSNFDFSPKMRIFDNFRKTFLCKTKPIYKTCVLSMRCHLIGKMQNEPNGMLFKPKTKPIFSIKNTAVIDRQRPKRNGGGGIRTPGTLRYNGFQDRHLQPLGHSSGQNAIFAGYFCREHTIYRPKSAFSRKFTP